MGVLEEAEAERARRREAGTWLLDQIAEREGTAAPDQGSSPAARALAERDRRQRIAALLTPQGQAARQADERTFLSAVGDNLIGYDDGVRSFGEGLGTWLNIGGESATAGLVGDEAAAAMDWGLRGGAYDEHLARRRAQEAEYRADHPALALGADVFGAVAPAFLAVGAASSGANFTSQAVRGGAAGAALGATQGFMEGEGGVSNRVENAMIPAAIGGAVGTLLPVATGSAQAAWRRFGPGAAAALRRVQDQTGLGRAGAELAADAVARDRPFAREALAEAGRGAVNAEMGPNSQSLLDWAVNRPGGASARAAATVEDIAGTRGRAFRQTMDDVLGDATGVVRRQRDLMRDTAASRHQAYAAAYGAPIDYASQAGQTLERLLGRVPTRAIKTAQQMMRTEGVQSRQILFREQPDGSFTWERMPDVRELDYITRALNDMKDPLSSGVGPAQRNAYGNLATKIRETLDGIVPEYAAARAAGGDAIANREAIEFGASLLSRTTPMDVAEDTIARMGPAERAFARAGLRDQLAEVMGNARRAQRDRLMDMRQVIEPLKQMLTEAGERKLVALLGPDDAAKLLQSAREAYSALSMRAGVARGSPTAIRAAWEDVIDRYAPVGAAEALQEGRGLSGAAAAVVRPLLGDPAAGRVARREQIVNALADVLLAPAGSSAGANTLAQLPALLAAADRTGGRVAFGAANALAGLGQFMAQQAAEQR